MIKSLLLHNFRNYDHTKIFFHPEINLFVGNNGQGKTNLLEAFFILSTGRSFRSFSLSEAIMQNQNSFYLEATLATEETEETLSLHFDASGKKVVEHNGKTRFSPLGIFPMVLSTPMDIALIYGPPLERRKFLNLHLVQSDPLYVHHSLRYQKCLKERNVLLKKNQENLLSTYEEEMAKSAAYITEKREFFVQELKENAQGFWQELTKMVEPISLAYQPSIPWDSSYEKKLLTQLRKNREREKKIGYTLQGPHRDDLGIFMQNIPLKSYGSEGQKRLAILSLRLAEWKLLTMKTRNHVPFLLDDFSAFLDRSKKENLLKNLSALGQVLITSVEKPSLFLNNFSSFFIEKGQVTQTCLSNFFQPSE